MATGARGAPTRDAPTSTGRFTDPAAAEAKHTQYYEMLGSRAIYHEGWTAVTWHAPGTDWDDDPWVEFSSSDLSEPKTIRYAYFLKGYDRDWIETDSSHRVLNYTNLDPGKYELLIKTTNRLGEWSDKEYGLSIFQKPAWFQTVWFKLIVVLLSILLIVAFIGFRVRQLKKQGQELKEIVNKKTSELKIKNQALKKALTHLEEISLTDQSTSAYNRRFINNFIEQDLAKLKREHKKSDEDNRPYFGFLIIDIDHFKHVNDAYGHSAGDNVLLQIVKILQKTCRESDWVVRWGGEEFLVVARYVDRSEIIQLAERIRKNIESHDFDLGNGKHIKRTCSIGTSSYPFISKDVEALSWEQTLNLADFAMYIAKNNGRNLWVSLTEKNISDPKAFYQSAMDNICIAVNQGLLELESSNKEKVLECIKNQLDSFARKDN